MRPIHCYRVSGWDGHSQIVGSTVVGDPAVPVAGSRVGLLTGALIPIGVRVLSSSATGDYTFVRVRSTAEGYAVIAFDPSGVYDPAAKANLVPSPMPPDPAEHP